MKAILCVLLALVALPAGAIEEGYVYGDNHCFYFGAPQGWIADHVSGRNQGLPFVFYPNNSTWASAKIVAYARVADKADGVNDPGDQVERTIRQFRKDYESPNIRAQKIGTIEARSGAVGEIYKFEGDKWGNTELVVYFSGRKTINFFVISSRDAGDLNKHRVALEELARSYREANDCKPCAGDRVTLSCSGRPEAPSAPLAALTGSAQPTMAELRDRNREHTSTAEGKRYETDAVRAFWGDARFMRDCAPPTAPLAQSLEIFLEVNLDGRMGYLLIAPETPVAECIRRHTVERRFPPPPYPFVVNISLKFKE